jgi:hypothetical protein
MKIREIKVKKLILLNNLVKSFDLKLFEMKQQIKIQLVSSVLKRMN